LPTRVWTRAYLGLGSNVGERAQALSQAVAALGEHERLRVRRQASLYETEPVGLEAQTWFLNTALEVDTALAPEALLEHCKSVERALGRVPRQRWGPREIDVDLLLYGRWVVRTPGLIVPHTQMKTRKFVLLPLLELAPTLICPRERKRISDFVAALSDSKKVRPFAKKL